MKHEMNLREKYFDFIKFGTKRIEFRLLDEKRKKINIGDIITFSRGDDKNDYIDVRVIGLLRYASFASLVFDFDISILADKNINKEELLYDLGKYYTDDLQKKYGVVGIRFEII